MPYLVKKVTGQLLDTYETNVKLIGKLEAKVGVEDFIDVNTLIGFTQNFSRAEKVEIFSSLKTYGLRNNTNFTLLEISY